MAQRRDDLKDKLDARIEAARTWARRVKAELAVLPDTLEKLRDGATSFQAVGQRLEVTSASLEELTDLYGKTLGAAVRRSSTAAEALQQQLAMLPTNTPATPDLLSATVDELQRTMDALAAMNPFWPTPASTPTPRAAKAAAKKRAPRKR